MVISLVGKNRTVVKLLNYTILRSIYINPIICFF